MVSPSGAPSLPEVSLPNLTPLMLNVTTTTSGCEHSTGQHSPSWKGSSSARSANRSERDFHGDFLEAFENVALAAPASATLSNFQFHSSCSWNPSYHSLLSFEQLKQLVVEFSYDDGYSSRVDDEIIIALPQAMPKLGVLQLRRGLQFHSPRTNRTRPPLHRPL